MRKMFDNMFSRLDTIHYTNVADIRRDGHRSTANIALTRGVALYKQFLYTHHYIRLWRHSKANSTEEKVLS